MAQIFEVKVSDYTTTTDENKWFLYIIHIAESEKDLNLICEIFSMYIREHFSVAITIDVKDFNSKYQYKTKQKVIFDFGQATISFSGIEYNFNQN